MLTNKVDFSTAWAMLVDQSSPTAWITFIERTTDTSWKLVAEPQKGTFTIAVRDAIRKHIFGIEALNQNTIYVGLSSTAIDDTGAGVTEPSNGYSRVQVINWAVADRQAVNSELIRFPIATGNQGELSYWFIADAPSGGNILASAPITNTISVAMDQVVVIRSGALGIGFSSTWLFTNYANKILEHILGQSTLTLPTITVGLSTTTPSIDASNISEPVPIEYSRVLFSNWRILNNELLDNSGDIQFNTVTGDNWGTVEYCVLYDNTAPILRGYIGINDITNTAYGSTGFSIPDASFLVVI